MTSINFVLDQFVSFKRIQNIKYIEQEKQLRYFFRCLGLNHIEDIKKDSIIKTLDKIQHKQPKSYRRTNNILCDFLEFASKYYKVPVLPRAPKYLEPPYRPYIYTKEELRRFLRATKELRPTKLKFAVVNWELLHPLFYLLISTGLRPGEITNFRISDYDESNKTILIRNSKSLKDRIIPINDSCNLKLIEYKKQFLDGASDKQYFFARKDGKHINNDWLYYRFRQLLNMSKIKHSNKGPRIYDFRHTYATYVLYEWAKNNLNLHAMIPALSTYMGHKTYLETMYYVHEAERIFRELNLYLKSGFMDDNYAK